MAVKGKVGGLCVGILQTVGRQSVDQEETSKRGAVLAHTVSATCCGLMFLVWRIRSLTGRAEECIHASSESDEKVRFLPLRFKQGCPCWRLRLTTTIWPRHAKANGFDHNPMPVTSLTILHLSSPADPSSQR